jgi:type IV secretion system protein VirB10
MRTVTVVSILLFAALGASGDDQRNFSGSWKLNAARSDVRGGWILPDGFLRAEQASGGFKVAAGPNENAPLTEVFYPLGGKSQKSTVGEFTLNVVTKWEGDVLLVNTIVNGASSYSESERWERSRDGRRLTITRTVQRRDGESESVLIFEKIATPTAPAQTSSILNVPDPVASAPAHANAEPDGDFIVAAGTRILLTLTNSVNTKRSAPGDKVYLTTTVPVFVKGQLVIPQGSYVTGSITESSRAGKIKGKAALNLRFETLTLPTGVTRDFRSRAGSVDTQGSLDRAEGRIQGDSNKGGDIKTVGSTTAAGAGIGGIAGSAAGHVGSGVGIGAAAGALAGLGGVLASRGPDVVIPPGTTMELVLDRELRFSAVEILR